MENDSDTLPSRRLIQFSLRTLLIAMMLIAAYSAGWISHRAWNRRHLSETINEAMKSAEVPVQIEVIEGSDVLMTRGRKQDVDRVSTILEDARDAARK